MAWGLFYGEQNGSNWALENVEIGQHEIQGVPPRGLLHQLQEAIGPGGRERENKQKYIHTHLLHPANFRGAKEKYRGNLARKCLGRHSNARNAFRLQFGYCGAHRTSPSCFVLQKCHIFLKRGLVYYLVGIAGFFLRATNNSDPPFKNNPPLAKKKSERLTNGSNSKYLN